MPSIFQTPPSRRHSGTRLFCIPHAGAGPSAFRGWRDRLLPEIESTAVQLPGREGRFRERAYSEMGALAKDLAGAIMPWLRDGQPFAFFGNSLGALVAYETLHEIGKQTGRAATHLFVSAAGAPQCEPPLPPVSHLDDALLLREVNKRYGGIPAPLLADRDYLAILLSALRADLGLLEGYHHRDLGPLSCPITAFSGRRDATLPKEHVEAWREQTFGDFEHLVLDEDHLYLVAGRELLIRQVREALLNSAACMP